jgi:hypothetical protein
MQACERTNVELILGRALRYSPWGRAGAILLSGDTLVSVRRRRFGIEQIELLDCRFSPRHAHEAIVPFARAVRKWP